MRVPKSFYNPSQNMVNLPQQYWLHWYQLVFVRISISVKNHQDKRASWGRKGSFYFYFHIVVYPWRKPGQKLKAGTWRQELMQRQWKDDTYWIVPHRIHSHVSYRVSYRTNDPEMDTATVAGPPVNQELWKGFKTFLQPSIVMAFSQLEFFSFTWL